MNYQPYGYYPRYGAAAPAPAFYGGVAPVPAPAAQSATAAATGGISPGFAVQPVSSKEEALAVIADPMASGVLLPDLAHGVIYVKRFNPQTGTSDFGEFALVQQPAATENGAVVTVEMLNSAMEKLRAEFAAKGGRGKREAGNDE